MHHHQLVISYNLLYKLLEFKGLPRAKLLKLLPSRYARVFNSESKCNESACSLIPFDRTDHTQFVNGHDRTPSTYLMIYKSLYAPEDTYITL